MSQPNSSTVELARILSDRLAGSDLPPLFAKLYSQYTRLNANQPSLAQWQENEANQRLDDALQILEAGLIEKDAGAAPWRNSVRRAAELFEWISHPKLRPEGVPTKLYSAALYQISGYPARAAGILANPLSETSEANSAILTNLLKADFPRLLKVASKYWLETLISNQDTSIPWQDLMNLPKNLNEWLFRETVSSIGVLCASMRWGDEKRLPLALDKLKASSTIFLHGSNDYSGLLSTLTHLTSLTFSDTTLRTSIEKITQDVNANGQLALEKYIRQAYQHQRSLAWPSQIRGYEKLTQNKSFALCTPTGSGKTSVAEIAILQSLFEKSVESQPEDENNYAPLVIYLVPSRALAAEVEDRLSRVLKSLEKEPIIIVTGLYGGTDWGPTDAWITSNSRTILICTYEKAEALIRFLGPLFINRIKLVVIDEAHSVNFGGSVSDLQSGENRSLRLEALSMRLLSYIDETKGRAIALSAVASGSEQALSNWITGNENESPVTTNYRSTRQLIGSLECKPDGRFEIRYDLLDGGDLSFNNEDKSEKPFITDPFSSYPPVKKVETGVEKRLRPYLFWAAMNFASLDTYNLRHSVLISLTQNISGFAKDFLTLLENDWGNISLPSFFEVPTETPKKELWNQCLASCKDYFSENSYEYQLLKRGVVIHHGKMPGLMGRLLTRVVREKIVHVVIATSTLTDGVNLPFETILIPTLRRSSGYMNVREFRNLIGRAGRPGINTEGKSLVLLTTSAMPSDTKKELYSLKNSRVQYNSLIQLMKREKNNEQSTSPRSPIAELLKILWKNWQLVFGSESVEDFYIWLEKTAPVEFAHENTKKTNQNQIIELLDSVDGILLSAIAEIEQVVNKEISSGELEQKLTALWKRTYAFYSESEEKQLETYFARRGKALLNIYPDKQQRHRLYRTSMQPRPGSLMIRNSPVVYEHLKSGFDYAIWVEKQKYEYIRRTVELIGEMPKFSLPTPKKGVEWDEILQWWLMTSSTSKKPSADTISSWFDYISKNFSYRFNWGFGSMVSLSINEVNDGELKEFHLNDWHKTGLPWIVLWIKELITWGTLDPVAAYLLSQGMESTRNAAEKAAAIYYADNTDSENTNALLDPRNIRDWASRSLNAKRVSTLKAPPNTISAKLTRNFENTSKNTWRILPVIKDKEKILWFDPAGFLLAESSIPDDWSESYFENYDFFLNSTQNMIYWTPYL